MNAFETYLETVYRRKVSREYDRIIGIVADEGKGKSTLMCELTGRWQRIRGEEPTTESVLERIVWDDRQEFMDSLANSPKQSAVPVMDAAHILYKRDAVLGDQKKVEKGLLDVRTRELLIMLGFQAWGDIPTTLQNRRMKEVVRIPERGVIEVYGRQTLNKKQRECDPDEWPEPDMVDSFPSLEGTELWEQFKQRDREAKEKRLRSAFEDDSEDPEGEEKSEQTIASEIQSDGVSEYISHHTVTGRAYVDADLIQADYQITGRKASRVKSLLERDVEVDEVAV